MSNEVQELNEVMGGMMNAMDRIIAGMEKMEKMLDEIITEIDSISSEKLNNEASVSMVERWSTTGPR
jgi:hypothetical protein